MRTILSTGTLVLLISFFFGSLQAQNYNRPVPGGLHPYEFEQFDSTFQGFYLTGTSYTNNQNQPYYLAVLDPKGYIVWWTEDSRPLSDFKYLPDLNQFSYTKSVTWDTVHFYDMAPNMEVIDTLNHTAYGWIRPDNHEYRILPNGNRIVLTQERVGMDLSAYTFNGIVRDSNTSVMGNGLKEYDQAGNLVFSWRSTNHIHPYEFRDGYIYNPLEFDYAHANSIEQDTDGHLLVSFRHLNSVVKINHQTGDIIWRLGGVFSDFTFPNDPDGFSGQHTIRRLPNGRYSLFDNGNSRSQLRYSRAVEYELDTVNWTATLVYEYDAGQQNYSSAMGSYQHDVQGYKCLGWGYCSRPSPNITVLDESDNLISRVSFENYVISYRVMVYDLPFHFPRPVITCDDQGGTLTLTAEAGRDNYLWSTGETTSSISVADTGTYMVWVDHGVGKVGSQPFVISDLNGICPLVGAQEAVTGDNRPGPKDKITGYFDLTGKELDALIPGQLCIVRYASGRAKVVYKD